MNHGIPLIPQFPTAIERPPTTGFKSNTRPDTSVTNKILRSAALSSLNFHSPRSPREPEIMCLTERCALKEARALTDSLGVSGAICRRPQHQYASMGEYRPPVQKAQLLPEVGSERAQFNDMLMMVGEKIRQKFSKARDVFRFIDSDHSGSISRSEVHYFFRFFNVSAIEADAFFEGFERDEMDEIAYVEFVKYLWPYMNPGGQEQAHWSIAKEVEGYQEYQPAGAVPPQVFTTQKENHDGLANLPHDMLQARVNIAQRLDLKYRDRKQAFRTLDLNKDGMVSQQELYRFMQLMGWAHMADRFYDLLMERGNGVVEFRTFAELFSISKDSDCRLRL